MKYKLVNTKSGNIKHNAVKTISTLRFFFTRTTIVNNSITEGAQNLFQRELLKNLGIIEEE